MLYLFIQGGLGNQFFQYAFAKRMSAFLGEPFSIDCTYYETLPENYVGGNSGGLKLNDFNTSYSLGKYRISRIQNAVLKAYKLIKRKICKTRMAEHKFELKTSKFMSFWGIYIQTQGYIPFYKNTPFKNKYLEGYFESLTYLTDIDTAILEKEFSPIYPESTANEQLYNTLNNTESICVNIRRGDFIDNTSTKKGVADVCTIEYFQKGLEVILEEVGKSNASVIIFSNDIEWCLNNLKILDDVKVYHESGSDPTYETFRLMCNCKHFIISNSTFGWWAQRLARNKNKIVVAPSRWRNYECALDLYEKNWILIDPDTLEIRDSNDHAIL